jgi:hypothetical protein
MGHSLPYVRPHGPRHLQYRVASIAPTERKAINHTLQPPGIPADHSTILHACLMWNCMPQMQYRASRPMNTAPSAGRRKKQDSTNFIGRSIMVLDFYDTPTISTTVTMQAQHFIH